jgi:thiol-disulfide isomerase/thioredoxin
MKRNLLVLAGVLLLAGFALYRQFFAPGEAATASREPGPKLNAQAPAFALQALDGRTYEVGGAREKPVLLNFWASWCGPCELEAPDLVKLYDKYKDRIDFYAVNMTAGDRMDNIQSFVKHFKYEFPVLLDTEGAVGDLYRITGIPMTYLVDRNGVIRDGFGILKPEELEKRINKLIES